MTKEERLAKITEINSSNLSPQQKVLALKKFVEQEKQTEQELKTQNSINRDEVAGAFFSMLRGDKGDKGDKGDQGEKGDTGADSTVPGPQGERGDKGDSIKGDQGEPGLDGQDGINPNPQDVVPLVLEQIKLPEQKDFILDAKDIKNKLETLTKDDRLDISALKGTQLFQDTIVKHSVDQARGLLYAGLVDGSTGTGTVTSVSVVTANGVSGSVATATTTPAITLTLGAITPTQVNATGAGNNSFLGNVGIGTTNPGDKLHIYGTNPGVEITNAGDRSFDLRVGPAGTGKFDIADLTAGASRLVIDSTGNVGIGTTGPGAKLEVSTGNILLTTPSYTSAGSHGIGINVQNSGSRGFSLMSAAGVNLINFEALTTVGGALDYAFIGTDYSVPTMVFKNGNVGIGITSPTAVLNLKAGTATASTAPLKFTSGTDLTTAETGAVEYDGTNLHFTPTGTLRENIHFGSKGSGTLTAGTTTTITTAGAKTTSVILIQSTSAAITLLGVYVSTKNAGSFVLTHTTAAGTETFDWVIIN